ncbi:MAG: hypothetical protein JWN57_2812 [Frankiales bacterium]|jgi:uncharacterized OB-fold protein|nr:hypothetical protein [Frankiales bacterium]
MASVPVVRALALEPEPHLVAQECTACAARFFGRRAACASCFCETFRDADVPTDGEIVAFTIVAFAMPGVAVPYVAATVDCGGTTVQANIVGVEPTPEHVHLGQKVRLTTYPLGTDSHGTEAIGFAFTPIGA